MYTLYDSREAEDLVNCMWSNMDPSIRPEDPFYPLDERLWNWAQEEMKRRLKRLVDLMVSRLGSQELLCVSTVISRPDNCHLRFRGNYIDSSEYRKSNPSRVFDTQYPLIISYEDGDIWRTVLDKDGMTILDEDLIRLIPDTQYVELEDSEELWDFISNIEKRRVPYRGWLRYMIPRYTTSIAPVFRDLIGGKYVVEPEAWNRVEDGEEEE